MKIKNRFNYIGLGVVAGVVILAETTSVLGKERSDAYQKEIAGKILRFHVIANSDTTEDQALKLKVRDAVGSYMCEELTDVQDMNQCRDIVNDDKNEIVKIAEQVLEEEGYNYGVTADLGYVDFPEKTYGCYTFPEGTYEALEIKIGSGSGHNWWCVMYPNMCFTSGVYEVIDEEAKQSLEHILTKEEYQSLLEDKNYEVRFKYLTFLNQFLK